MIDLRISTAALLAPVLILLPLAGAGCPSTPGNEDDYVIYRMCLSDEEKSEHDNTRSGIGVFILYSQPQDEFFLDTGNLTVGSDGVSTATADGDADQSCYSFEGRTVDVDYAALDDSHIGFRADAPNTRGGIDSVDGEVAVVAMGLDADFPVQPEHHYQYGFVFDTDGDPANDYVASPAYPSDFFQGTDRWYQLVGSPSAGWDFSVQDIVGGVPTAATSNATVVAFGNAVALLAPVDELGDAEDIGFRMTAFRHDGNWLADDWSGDYHPDVSDPLQKLVP